jgi:hypothetical protein
LSRVDDDVGAHILLIFWRTWHLRNNVMHGDGLSTVIRSAKFLLHLWDSLGVAADKEEESENGKGKRPLHDGRSMKFKKKDSSETHKWEPPPRGWVKLNVDAAYCQGMGAAGMGLIIRDEEGQDMLTAWRAIKGCG